MRFLGEWFGQSDNDVVLPAMIVKKDGKKRIMTKKFVSIKENLDPSLKIKVYEKLTEAAQAQEGAVAKVVKTTLESKASIDGHNLRKLRNALNMMTNRVGEEDRDEEELKAWYGIIDKYRQDNNKRLEESGKENAAALQSVDAGLSLVKDVLYPADPRQDKRERMLRMKGMGSRFKAASSAPQNNMIMKKRNAANSWMRDGEASRSSLQMKTRTTDYTMDDLTDEVQEENAGDIAKALQ